MLPPELAMLICRQADTLRNYCVLCLVWGVYADRQYVYTHYWKFQSVPHIRDSYDRERPIIIWKLNGVASYRNEMPTTIWWDTVRGWTHNNHFSRDFNRPAFIDIEERTWYFTEFTRTKNMITLMAYDD